MSDGSGGDAAPSPRPPVSPPGALSSTAKGRAFEAVAAEFLESNGLEVVARNHRNAGGELDIIAWDGPILVFVEVRSRAGNGGLDAAHSVTPKKQARVARAAGVYLQTARRAGPPPRCRFDVVVNRTDGIVHFKDAFRAGG